MKESLRVLVPFHVYVLGLLRKAPCLIVCSVCDLEKKLIEYKSLNLLLSIEFVLFTILLNLQAEEKPFLFAS